MDKNEKNIQSRNWEQKFHENSFEVDNTPQITNKEYECNICKNDFDTHEKITKHLIYIHVNDRNSCNDSSKSLETTTNLKNDAKNVHKTKIDESATANKCESCSKSFSRAHGLKKHIHTIHQGHKDHKCESCGKSFSQAGYLKRHIHIVHEGHKDHKCESCGKEFSQAGHLKRHTLIHKEFKCESCAKLFFQEGDLKRHLYTVHEDININTAHKGHKDYKCCGKSFSQAENLKKHINIVHIGNRRHQE